MRKFINILYFASISLVLSFTACDQDNLRESYDSNLATGYSMYSPTIITDIITGENVMKVQVSRTNTNEESTIQITLTASDPEVLDIFSLKSSTLTFPKGVSSVDAEILINFDDLGTDQYSIVVSLADPDLVSLGGISSTTIRARLKLEYEDYGKGWFSSEFFEEEWEVNLQKADGATYFVIQDCYFDNYPIYFGLNNDMTQIVHFEERQQTGYVHPTYGMVSVSLEGYSISGKTITFILGFYIPDGRTFGTAEEVLTLP